MSKRREAFLYTDEYKPDYFNQEVYYQLVHRSCIVSNVLHQNQSDYRIFISLTIIG